MNTNPANPVLSFAKTISKAWETSHIETVKAVLQPVRNTLKLRFSPQQINTYKLIPVK